MHAITISLIIALILLITTFTLFFFIRYRYSKWYRAIPIAGVFISGAIAFFPLNTDYNLFSNIAASFLDSAKLFFLESNYYETIADVFFYLGSESILGETVFAILFIIAPVCTAAIIISCISDVITYLGLKIPTIESKYVFSGLNEKTLSLAMSMKENGMRGIYIFCNVSRYSRDQNPFYEKAKRNKCLVIEKLALSIPPSKAKDTYYFAMSENASENLDLTLRLMEMYKSYSHVKIYITSNEAEDEALLDNKIEELKDVKFFLRHINETQLMAYELLDSNPLYHAVREDWNKVSMLIIGGGYAGLEVLKNSIWCSRSLNYKFDATVLDRDIARSEGIFSRFAPALKKEEYNITFAPNNINADTKDVLNFVESNKGRFNYLVISTDNDEVNIKTALDLQSWYLRTGYPAIISVSVRDAQKYELLQNLKIRNEKNSVHLFPFGCSLVMYSYQRIIESKLEKFAICINDVYNRSTAKFSGKGYPMTYKSAIASWGKLKLRNRRSSMALGVYIRYLLWMGGCQLTDNISSCSFKLTAEESEKFSELEHSRWNAYQLIEGFYPWSYDDFKNSTAIRNNIAQDKGKRLHACITDWDTLKEIDSNLNSRYADYDREFILAIPDIVSGFNGEYKYQCGIEKCDKGE